MKKIILAIFTIMLAVAIFGCGKTQQASGGGGSSGGGGGGGIIPYAGDLYVNGNVSYDPAQHGFTISAVQYLENKDIEVWHFSETGLEKLDGEFAGLKTTQNGEYALPKLEAENMYLIKIKSTPELVAFVFGQGNKVVNVDPISSTGVLAVTKLLDSLGVFNKNVNAANFAPFIESVANDLKKYYVTDGHQLPDLTDEQAVISDAWNKVINFNPGLTTYTHWQTLMDGAFNGDNYSISQKNTEWSAENNISKWTGVDSLAIISGNSKTVSGFDTVKITKVQLAKTDDNTTLNILITFDKSLYSLTSDKWAGLELKNNSHAYDFVTNNGLIRLELKDANALYKGGGSTQTIIYIYKDKDNNNWVTSCGVANNGNWDDNFADGKWGSFPIRNYGNSIELAIPLRSYMRSKPMYAGAGVISFGDTPNDWVKWSLMDYVPYTKIQL
jgi:hypothetical protein